MKQNAVQTKDSIKLSDVRFSAPIAQFPDNLQSLLTAQIEVIQAKQNFELKNAVLAQLRIVDVYPKDKEVQFVYKGPVGVTTLLNDLDQIERMENANRHERFEWSAGRDGIAIDQEQVKQSRDFSEVKLRFQFASLISKVGQFEEAANQYRKIIRIAPRFAKAYNSLGLAFYNMRGNDLSHKREAIRYYEKSRELDPNEAQVHYNLGIVHLDFKQPAKAKKHFENAIRLKPNNADAQCDLGTAMAMFGDLPGAIVQFKKALEIDPDHRARSNLELAHQLLSK